MEATDVAVSWWQVVVATGVPLGVSAVVWVVKTISKAENRLVRRLDNTDELIRQTKREAAMAGRSARAAHRRLDRLNIERREWPAQR